jgi:hypothetical protein
MKTTMKFTKQFEKEGIGNIMEGVNMLNVHYMHVWTYHNETPSYYY